MRTSSLFLVAFTAPLVVIAASASAQETPVPQPPAPKPPALDRDTVLVQGRYDAVPLDSPFHGGQAKDSRAASSDARMFVRCIHQAPAALLRPIVEGHARDPATHDALDKVIRTNSACYNGFYGSPQPMSPFYGECNKVKLVCRSVYDRGALIEDALKTYAPRFMLMRGDTLNNDVIARFRVREEARGKFRSPMDRRFYDTVACMVQMEPERATRLLRAEPGLEREARYRRK